MGHDAMKVPILQAKGLGKRFVQGGIKKEVLKGISFNLEEGEFLCILGPSGCGKTTLLKCLASFEEPTAGTFLLSGQKPSRPGRDRIMIFQDFNQLFPWKTLLGNLLLPLHLEGVRDKQGMVKDGLDILEAVGLRDYARYYPHTLSGGMMQRAVIARALILNPRVLLMDEPFGSLDAQIRFSLQNLLVSLWRERNLSLLFVTHDLEEAIILSQRIIILSSEGEIKTILENPLERPRDPSSPEFQRMRRRIYSLIDPLTR